MEINIPGNPSTLVETPIEKNPNPIQPVTVDNDESEIQGLAREELNDPNKIQITIADKQNPNSNMCREYNEMVNNNNAAGQTSRISFMLVRVIDDKGRTICQILEAPGELYYDPNKPNADFPRYVNAIKNGTNRKVWCYFVEPDWKDEADRRGYADKISSLKRNMKPVDKAVFVFNKIDLTPFVISPGQINKKQARREVENLYPGIFEPFRSKGVFGTSDNFEFVPFHTGDYSKTYAGEYTFEPGPDEYPRALWNVIKKLVRG